METLEFVKKAVDGRITLQLPEEWKDKEVIITVIDGEIHPEHWSGLPGKEKTEILKRFAGSAKFPDTPTDKYEVYEQ